MPKIYTKIVLFISLLFFSSANAGKISLDDKFARTGARLVDIAADEVEADWLRLQQQNLVTEKSRIVAQNFRSSAAVEQLKLIFAVQLRESDADSPELHKRLTLRFLQTTRYRQQRGPVKAVLRSRLESLIRALLNEPKCKRAIES